LGDIIVADIVGDYYGLPDIVGDSIVAILLVVIIVQRVLVILLFADVVGGILGADIVVVLLWRYAGGIFAVLW